MAEAFQEIKGRKEADQSERSAASVDPVKYPPLFFMFLEEGANPNKADYVFSQTPFAWNCRERPLRMSTTAY